MDFVVVRAQFDGVAEVFGGEGETPLFDQGDSPVVVRFGEVALETNGTHESSDSGSALSRLCQGDAVIVVGFGQIGLEEDDPVVVLESLVALAERLVRDGEMMVEGCLGCFQGDGLDESVDGSGVLAAAAGGEQTGLNRRRRGVWGCRERVGAVALRLPPRLPVARGG